MHCVLILACQAMRQISRNGCESRRPFLQVNIRLTAPSAATTNPPPYEHEPHQAERRVAASSLELTSSPPIGLPFRPQSARCMRGEQFGFPAFRWEFSEGVHDGRHATRCIAGPTCNTLRMVSAHRSPSRRVGKSGSQGGWKWREHKSRAPAYPSMVVVPAIIEGAALSVALVPFVLHRWDMYRWDQTIETHTSQRAPT